MIEILTLEYLGRGIREKDIEYLYTEDWANTIRYWKRQYKKSSYVFDSKCKITFPGLFLAKRIKELFNIEVLPSILKLNNGYRDKSAGEPFSMMLIKGCENISDEADGSKILILYFPVKLVNRNTKFEYSEDGNLKRLDII